MKAVFFTMCTIVLIGCSKTTENNEKVDNKKAEMAQAEALPLFSLMQSNHTNITFQNKIIEDENYNSFYYDYMYNGGGVAIGDIDNDGLEDLFFSGNMTDNRLYRNLGDFKFEDITNQANTAAKGTWSTGASFVDINADGYQDLYVCRSFDGGNEDIQRNLLYINNGNLTFTESAKTYGLDDAGFSTQASFFDYDKDGDLDVYIANHPIDFHPADPSIRYTKWKNPSWKESNHLYENKGDGLFEDITAKAGLLGYDYTLGVVTADINGDSWPDIYITNDYEHPDRYYINQKDGTFKESLRNSFRHTSNFAMGVDFADVNNDALSDIAVVDMVAEDNYRQKTMMPSMNPTSFWANVRSGYHYQYMRNSLQLNGGDGTFAEIGQLSGIAKTDWSWAVLLADFDLDGWKDMYVTNGYYRDTRNVDYRNYYKKYYSQLTSFTKQQVDEILRKIPSQKITNYYFKNNKDLTFKNYSKEAGINTPSFSNGASYADLDNDGDLDLVVNNLADQAFIYKNNSRELEGKNFLKVKLIGEGQNTNGIGAKLTLRRGGETQTRMQLLTRGYQSGVSNVLHFGLGDINTVDELKVEWASGKTEKLANLKANQLLVLEENSASLSNKKKPETSPIFSAINNQLGVNYRHIENRYDDYAREILLPHKMSQMGPKVGVGDANDDQLDDLFIGGASGSAGALYIQTENGTFNKSTSNPWTQDFASEDMGIAFFDSDSDGDQDIYIVSGSNELEENHKLYNDRLYLNDGNGNYSKTVGKIPELATSGSCVLPQDFDGDGDMDLFIGGRQVPGKYPLPTNSYILENKGGIFTDVTQQIAPELHELGMVSTAVWSDFDGDNATDLIIAGEWMPIRMFKNTAGKFIEVSNEWGLDSTNGWWNKLVACDLNQDGLTDYIAGNLGKNYKYKASKLTPFPVFVNDFDKSGSLDIVLGYSNSGEYYPVRGRECSSQQMPNIKDKFPSYHEFGQAKLIDIYGDELNKAIRYNAYEFASVALINKGNGFEIKKLPVEAQFSAVQGIVVEDFTQDGIEDVLLAGNFFVSEVETGRADASTGLLLKGMGDGSFTSLSSAESGFFAPSDVRDLQKFTNAKGEIKIIVANNNFAVQLFELNKKGHL